MPDNLEIIKSLFERLEDKVDHRFNKMEDEVKAISITTAKNTIILEEHQRRSIANEKHADLLEEQIKIERDAVAAALILSEENQSAKVDELAESVELITKLPKYLYKVAIWLAAVAAGGSALYAILNFLLTHAR